MNDREMKAHIAAIYAAQRKPSGNGTRCPRCGKAFPNGKQDWKMSHHETVFVCPSCFREERMMLEIPGPRPLRFWWVFNALRKAGELPNRHFMRAIDLELQDDPHVVQATFECCFDVQTKFDIDFSRYPGDPYINLYADYNVLTGELSMFYTIVSDLEDEAYDYVPTATERETVITNMEAESMAEVHGTLAAFAQEVGSSVDKERTEGYRCGGLDMSVGKGVCRITKEMVSEGYRHGFVKLILSPNGDGVACAIGDNWFYFGGITAEACGTVEEYTAAVPTEAIVRDIFCVLEDFRRTGDVFTEEYLYYYWYLRANLPPAGAVKSEV